jgi:hypothetical protein
MKLSKFRGKISTIRCFGAWCFMREKKIKKGVLLSYISPLLKMTPASFLPSREVLLLFLLLLPSTTTTDVTVSPSHPPLSAHQSNLYTNSELVQEISIDPSEWNWNEVNAPVWAFVLYAPWCGHCQQFKSVWEDFARQAHGAMCSGSTLDRQVQLRVGAVNCVAHGKICDDHGLQTYPTLILVSQVGEVQQKNAHEEKLTMRTVPTMVDEIKAKLGCKTLTFSKTATNVVSSVNLRGGSNRLKQFKLVEESSSNNNSNDHNRIDETPLSDRLEDAQRAMKFSLLQLFAGRHTMNKEDFNAAMQWINALHDSSQVIFDSHITRGLKNVIDLWSQHPMELDHQQYSTLLHASNLLSVIDDVESLSTTGWKTCRDASISIDSVDTNTNSVASIPLILTPHKRGFTCGLWTLFHLMGSNAPDSRVAVQGIIQFIRHFFQCEECREHFMREYGTDVYIEKNSAMSSKRSASEWLWKAHNGVNERLRAREAKESPWMLPYPSCKICPECCHDDDVTLNEDKSIDYVVNEAYCVNRNDPNFECEERKQRTNRGVTGRAMSANVHLHQGWWIFGGVLIVIVLGCFSKVKRGMHQVMTWKTV